MTTGAGIAPPLKVPARTSNHDGAVPRLGLIADDLPVVANVTGLMLVAIIKGIPTDLLSREG
jgi:hypothetical protein